MQKRIFVPCWCIAGALPVHRWYIAGTSPVHRQYIAHDLVSFVWIHIKIATFELMYGCMTDVHNANQALASYGILKSQKKMEKSRSIRSR